MKTFPSTTAVIIARRIEKRYALSLTIEQRLRLTKILTEALEAKAEDEKLKA